MKRLRARRKHRRGAALVEAMVVIPVLILLDVALLYMYDAYETKLATMRMARRAVWTEAVNYCEGVPGGGSGRIEGTSSEDMLGRVADDIGRAKSVAKGSSLKDKLEVDIGRTSAGATLPWSGHVVFGDSDTKTTAHVACNERPADVSQGDIQATVNAIYGDWL